MEFWDHLQMQLEHKGFCRVENKKNWYWQEENPVLYLICLLDGAEEGWREENMTFADFAGKMEGSVEEFHCTRVVALSVLVDNQEGILPVDSVETAFQTYDNKLYRVFWHFSPETGRLSAAQGQPTQLLGVEKLLRAAAAGREPEVLVLRDTKEQKTPVATAVIFVICAALLAWCMLSGQREEILSAYGLSREGILAGEYYRFFTCMFLHAGLLHLASNSIYLYYFGVRRNAFWVRENFWCCIWFRGFAAACSACCSVAMQAFPSAHRGQSMVCLAQCSCSPKSAAHGIRV